MSAAITVHAGDALGVSLERAVILAVEGDRLPVDAAGARKPAYVAARCPGAPCLLDAEFYCLSCNQRLANFGQLEMHLEAGTHVVARSCPEHGWEAL